VNILLHDDYHLLGDDNHHSHRRGNLKSYILLHFCQYRLSDHWGAADVTTDFKSFILIRNRYTESEFAPAFTIFAGCWVRGVKCNYLFEVKNELLVKATVSTCLFTYLIVAWVLKILSVHCSSILY
jgi:hypothetical protein